LHVWLRWRSRRVDTMASDEGNNDMGAA
jgi:hypothetical protein